MIGVSTGGPMALKKLFADLPPLDAAFIIVLHIPPGMDYRIAKGLEAVASMPVTLAEDGEYLRKRHIYLAAGGFHLKLEGNSRIILEEGERITGYSRLFNMRKGHHRKYAILGKKFVISKRSPSVCFKRLW